MSADLGLFVVRNDEPFDASEGKRYFYFGARFSIDIRRAFVEDILAAVDGTGLSQYEGVFVDGWEDFDPLEWVPASALKSLATNPYVQASQNNRAVWAYLKVLDDDNPVGMHWAF